MGGHSWRRFAGDRTRAAVCRGTWESTGWPRGRHFRHSCCDSGDARCARLHARAPNSCAGNRGDTSDDEEVQVARKTSIRAGAAAVESDGGTDEFESTTRTELHELATQQLERLEGSRSGLASRLRLRLAMIAAEREAVIAMRDRSEISDAVMRRLQKKFDHEETLLHQRYGK